MLVQFKKYAGLTMAAVLAASPVVADDFIYGSWFGANHTANTLGLTPYFDLLRETSNGEINWELVPGAQLSSGPGTPEAVGEGLMDGGIAIAPYQPRLMAATNTIFSHSLLGNDIMAAGGAMNEAILLGCPECRAEYDALNAVAFGGYATTPYVFMCNAVVNTVEDLAGLKVRSSGGGVNISEIAGAIPVSMSPAEATTGMERGTLDCVLGAVSWLRSYGYMDVVKTVVESPMGMGGPPILMFVNRDTWNSMTPEMRKMHIDHAPDLVAGVTYEGQMMTDDVVIAAAKEAGVSFTPDNEGFANLMVERDKQQLDINLQNAADARVEHAPEIIEYYVAAYEKWKTLLDEQGHDKETFRRLLWEEIYSKIDPETL